jgi:hypothetical protein
MNGSQYCIAAYAIGLLLILGYAANVWLSCVRARRRKAGPVAPVQIVVNARTPVPSRTG